MERQSERSAKASERMEHDAARFLEVIKCLEWQPAVWKGDGEIGIEWIGRGKHAVVSIEGDGRYGYTMLFGETFVAGEIADPEVNTLPDDLRHYLVF